MTAEEVEVGTIVCMIEHGYVPDSFQVIVPLRTGDWCSCMRPSVWPNTDTNDGDKVELDVNILRPLLDDSLDFFSLNGVPTDDGAGEFS